MHLYQVTLEDGTSLEVEAADTKAARNAVEELYSSPVVAIVEIEPDDDDADDDAADDSENGT